MTVGVDPEEPSTEPIASAVVCAEGDNSHVLAEAEAPEQQQMSSDKRADSAQAAADADDDGMQETADLGSEHPGEVKAMADEVLDVLVSELSTEERSSSGQTSWAEVSS